MKIRNNYILVLTTGLFLLTCSCVEDLDFDQIDDVVLTPVFEADFIYSEFDVENFIPEEALPDTGFDIPLEVLRDTVDYDLVGTDFAIDNLDRVELTIEARNTIQRPFVIQFQFLTAENVPLSELYIVPVEAGFGENSIPVISFSDPNPIVLDNATLNELASTAKIATEIIVSTLNTDLRGVLEIRSKAGYYVNLEL